MTAGTNAPSEKQVDYVHGLRKKLRMTMPTLEGHCQRKYESPFASLDRAQVSSLIEEMLGWVDVPANLLRDQGQMDLPDPAIAERKKAEARARAIEWAQVMVADANAVYLDTETCGTGPHSEIVDIAIVGSDGIVLLDELVKPTGLIPADAIAIHGITNEMVADAPQWEQLYERVASLLTGRRTIVYNAGYDGQIINNSCARANLDVIKTQWQCAMLSYSDFDGTPSTRGDGMKWHKLDAAAARFNIPPGGHRALADTQTARLVVAAMAAEGVN